MANMVIGDYSAAGSIDGSTHYLLIQPGSSSTQYNKINRNVFLGVSGQPVDISTSQSLTNKTLDNTNILTVRDDRFTLQDSGDVTKQALFQLSGITTATTRTYTLPNASSTLADISTAQTLTNKTLTSPIITGGSIDNTTITVDSISGHTTSTVVTVGGVQLNNGIIGTSNAVVTASIADSAVTPAKLLAGTGTGWTWQAWTPIFVNWTIGTGGSAGTTARFIQIGKTVFYSIKSTLGTSGQAVGSSVTFTLPVTAQSGGNSPIGIIMTGGTANATGQIWANSTTVGQLIFQNVASTYAVAVQVSSSVPFSWAAGDSFTATGTFEAA